jgi:hypothetical protein
MTWLAIGVVAGILACGIGLASFIWWWPRP